MPQKPHEDQKYIDALLNNDHLLIDEIYKKWHKDVLSFVLKNSGNEQDADDIFQESIMALLVMAEKKNFKLTVPLGGLLHRIYRRRWIDKIRKKGIERASIKELRLYAEDKVISKVADEVSKTYKKQKLLEICFEKLSDRCKQILNMSMKGYSRSEMVIQLKSASENAVYQSIFRCKTKLLELMKNYQ